MRVHLSYARALKPADYWRDQDYVTPGGMAVILRNIHTYDIVILHCESTDEN